MEFWVLGCDWWLEKEKERGGRGQRWIEEKPLKKWEQGWIRMRTGLKVEEEEVWFILWFVMFSLCHIFVVIWGRDIDLICLRKYDGCDCNYLRVKEKINVDLGLGVVSERGKVGDESRLHCWKYIWLISSQVAYYRFLNWRHQSWLREEI